MRMTYHISLLAGLLAFTASCTDETLGKTDIEKTNGQEVAFTAFAEPVKSDNTRTYYGGYNTATKSYPIFWASKDNIVVASPMGQSGRDNAVYHIEVPTNDAGEPEKGGASYADKIVLNNEFSEAGVQWGKNTAPGSFYSIYPYCAETLRRPAGLESIEPIDRYYNSINLKDNGKVTATAKVENVQRIWAPVGNAATNIGSATEPNWLLNMYGSNHALVMWAQTDNVKQGESVNLRFSPLSTCLMMTFSCTAQSAVAGTNFPAMVEKITIDAGTDIIAGDMLIEFSDPSTEGDDASQDAGNDQTYNNVAPTCTLVEETGKSTIEIIPWIRSNDMESGIHPTIGYGQKMQICAFLLPTQKFDMSKWTITVEVNGASYSRSMKPTIETTTENGGNHIIQPGEVHPIEFPAFDVTKEWNYDPASWMNDIDDNVYLTQITFPGSWNSYCRDNSTSGGMNNLSQQSDYQTLDFEKQMLAGVRAFDLPTRSGIVGMKAGTPPTMVVLSGTGSTGTGNQGEAYYRDGKSVGEAIDKIAKYVSVDAPTETAVVVLSYEPEGTGGHRPIDYAYWLYGLKEVYDALTYKGAIYAAEIGPGTTLGDVRGKVVLKVNLGDDVCTYFNTNEDYQYTSGLPALFSYSTLKWILTSKVADQNGAILGDAEDYDFTNKSLTTALGWNKWTGLWNKKLIYDEPEKRSGLYAWNYSCVNRTYPGSGETVTNGLPTIQNRKNALNTLVNEASSVYKLGYTNEWFLFGCGGMYANTLEDDFSSGKDDSSGGGSSSSGESGSSTGDDDKAQHFDWNAWYAEMQTNIKKFASDMNPWVNDQIKDFFKYNTPLPLGIVFVNQIGTKGVTVSTTSQDENGNDVTTDTEYNFYGDEILTNLIKMNNAFYLKRKPVTAATPESAPRRTRAEDSKFKTESNGWTVYSHSGN